jgi:hypothetical protein
MAKFSFDFVALKISVVLNFFKNQRQIKY